MKTEIFSFNNLKKGTIKSPNGDTFGDIHDVLLNPQTGEIACLLLGSGGFLGMGEKYLPVPFEVLTYNAREDIYYLNVQVEKFKGAPYLDLGKSGTRADRQYLEEVFRYYGYKPGF